MPKPTSTPRFLSTLAAAYVVATAALWLARAPSPPLLGGVIAGAFCALRLTPVRPFPVQIRHLGLALIGAGAGALIDTNVLRALAHDPVAILGGVVVTLFLSMAAGQILRASAEIGPMTALFSSIAGASSGVTAIAREMDADEAVVSAIQYLRVVVVLATVPLLAPLLGDTGTVATHVTTAPSLPSQLGFTATCVVAGLLLAHWLSFSGSRLIIPMLIASGFSIAGTFPSPGVPDGLMNVAYTITGLAVGFSFTPKAIGILRRLIPLVLLQLVISVAGCALLGVAFAALIDIPALDGYLATTPAGMPAVTAVALSSSANVGLIMTMQILRIFIALLFASAIGSWLNRRPEPSAAPEAG